MKGTWRYARLAEAKGSTVRPWCRYSSSFFPLSFLPAKRSERNGATECLSRCSSTYDIVICAPDVRAPRRPGGGAFGL